MRKPRPSTNQPVPVSTNGAGLTSTGPWPQFIVTSARISAVTSATPGLARRIASWTLNAAAAGGSASHAVASRSPATTALMPSPTYHGRTAGTMARRFRLFALPAESLLIVLGRLGELALPSERQAQVGVSLGEVGLDAKSLLEVLDRLGWLTLLEERGAPVAAGKGQVGIDAQRLLEVVDRVGRLTLLKERGAPIAVSEGKVGIESQRLLEVIDRLGRLAQLTERRAPVVVGDGEVGFEAQRVREMVDRLGRPALSFERHAPVVVSEGIVGLGAQRVLEKVDRLGQPALTIEQLSEVGVSDGRVGVDRKGVGPQPPRVVPDLDLVPGEDSQRDDDTRGNAGNPPRRRCPRRARGEAPAGRQAGADQDRPSGGGEIGVSIGRNPRAVLCDAEHRQEDDHVRQPRRRNAGASTAESQTDSRDARHPAG